MSETTREIDPSRVARLLTRSAGQLDDDTVTALRRARNLALERQIAARPAMTLNTGHHFHWPHPHTTSQWAATVTLVVAMVAGGVGYWHHAREHEISHLEVGILTDDMPLEVFVDR
jgi:hypothetical protein